MTVMDHCSLIYDDSCPVCLAGIEKVRQYDRHGLVELIPLSRASTRNDLKLPPQTELSREIHLISSDGKIYKGSDALAHLARLLPKPRLLGRMLLLPGIRQLARPLYRLIAKHRLKISGLLKLGQ